MRRDELDALRIHLPALATVALGALPGDPVWASRLMAAGVDVVASGAERDTPDTCRAAREAVPFRPLKARAAEGDALDALAAAGAVIVETAAAVPAGVYRLGPDEAVVAVVDGTRPEVEDPNVVARAIVDAARTTPPSGLWVVSTPGMDRLPADVVEAKLAALAECAYRARLVFAKEQFADDDTPPMPSPAG